MKNKKGFVLTETLVVTVFLITISTFVYVSIVPLMGRYEDLTDREKDINVVYKLYNIRKILYNDYNKGTITSCINELDHTTVKPCAKLITCSDFLNRDLCNNLIEQSELTDYLLIYVDNIRDNIDSSRKKVKLFLNDTIDTTGVYDYIKNYQSVEGQYLILFDKKNYTIAHLLYAPFIQNN